MALANKSKKKRANLQLPDTPVVGTVLKPRPSPPPTIPTEDRRHMTAIRLGKLPGDVFSKRRLAMIHGDDYWGGEEENNAKGKEQEAATLLLGRPGAKGQDVNEGRAKKKRSRKGVQEVANSQEKAQAPKKGGRKRG